MKPGEKYNMLTVIGKTKKKRKKSYLWEFRCDCGKTAYNIACLVKSGATKSCGCLIHNKPNADDLTGRKYGKLQVVQKTKKKTDSRYLWECRCDCGNIVFVPASRLKSGNTSSCGCVMYDEAKKVNYKELKFEKLTVLERNINPAKWLCRCDCGNEVIVYGNQLKHGTAKSCGCLSRENIIKRNKEMSTHKMSNTRLYNIWTEMKGRCSNKRNTDYRNYGARGITFYDEWKKFEPFMKWATDNGYRDDLTLERINVNGNYYPVNCKWIPSIDQNYNKTTSRFIEYEGEKKTVAQWAKIIGISRQGLRYRLEAGWNLEDLFTRQDQGSRRIEGRRGSKRTKMLTIHGVTKPMLSWAEEIGIKYCSLANRIDTCWTEDELLLPKGSKRKSQ